MVMDAAVFLMASGGSSAAAADRGIAASRTASSVRIAGKDGRRRGKLALAGGESVTKVFVEWSRGLEVARSRGRMACFETARPRYRATSFTPPFSPAPATR